MQAESGLTLASWQGRPHRLVRCWAVEGSAQDLLGVTDERCCQIAGAATSAMRGELGQCGRPVPAEPGGIDEVIDFIEEHGDSALRGALILWLIHLPAGGRAQHPGVDLDRSLPKGVPIDHARPVNEIEHMAEIEAAVSQVRTARWRHVLCELVAHGACPPTEFSCRPGDRAHVALHVL